VRDVHSPRSLKIHLSPIRAEFLLSGSESDIDYCDASARQLTDDYQLLSPSDDNAIDDRHSHDSNDDDDEDPTRHYQDAASRKQLLLKLNDMKSPPPPLANGHRIKNVTVYK
jgi:hypothetical protein